MEPIPPPPLRYLLLEARGPCEWASSLAALPLLSRTPAGDGHPVLVIPGFLGDDASTLVLRAFLRTRGYRAHGWRLGRNVGPTPEMVEGLEARFRDLVRQSQGEGVSVIGWSLGGIYAREIGRRFPNEVRQVILLASPFRDPFATHVLRLARRRRRRTGYRVPNPIAEALTRPLDVPCTSIYSRTDGVVHWRSCRLDPATRHQNVPIDSSHVGIGAHPLALWVIADRLAQPPGDWRPFDWPPALQWLARFAPSPI